MVLCSTLRSSPVLSTSRYPRLVSRSIKSAFSTSSPSRGYDDTLPNLKIGAHTKVLFQGFTGKQATANVQESLAWGTKIVGGVKPGVEGEHLGLPVFPSVRAAKEIANPDASAVYVPGNLTAKAIEEAIEAEIPLVVAVAEHVPIHDILRIHSMLKTQSKTRLVGANCPGIISAIGKCRIGFQPLPCFSPGHIGIVAKSGTLGYETVASTTRAGLGQSLCIGMGGDVLAGTDFVDALKVFEHDDDTHGIIIVGEIGGAAEMDAAEWIKDYHRRSLNPKPIMALVGGIQAPHGRIMGHAGAWAAPGEPDAQTKIRALQNAGAVLVDHPEHFGEGMKTLLSNTSRRPVFQSAPAVGMAAAQQHAAYHTLHRRPTRTTTTRTTTVTQSKRNLYVAAQDAFNLLKEAGTPVREARESDGFFLAVSVDRKSHSPCIIASPTADPTRYLKYSRRFPFNYNKWDHFPNTNEAAAISQHIGLRDSAVNALSNLLRGLVNLYVSKEAFVLETKVGITKEGVLQVLGARFGFDDAAYRSSKRQEDIQKLRNKAQEIPEEVEAEKSGMVYITLPGEGSIGTLVNGAGLAMNTVDALATHGGQCANFLDTGGKATSETVKSAFRILLSDPRVKTIFVNIFGGLTRAEMIAEGIIMAFRDLDMQVPVVVRLRGTNEKEGQKMIADSGLPLHAFDSFEEAAKKSLLLPTAYSDIKTSFLNLVYLGQTITEPPPSIKQSSNFRRFLGFFAIAIGSFSLGIATNPDVLRMHSQLVSIPSDEESNSLFQPSDEISREINDYINTHPLALSLRSNPAFTESRPHMKYPAELRKHSLTGGTLAGADKIVVPPYAWSEEDGKSFVSMFYLGMDLSGHPGIVHGGLLATLLDEGLARCCFPALPNRVGVTANLNIDYRRPAPAGSFFVLRAKTTKVEGRKAWVEGWIETLPETGKDPEIVVEAKALFVEPKNASVCDSPSSA
ncbi:hypothetical protein FQN57_003808 [Myotisia sp. PD_48]|nr:hypothetical protein FQN57_003808 [Myotisia sp. PD_48]